MRPGIDRRAVIAGGAAAGAGLVLAFFVRDSDRAGAQRIAQRLAKREETRVLAPPAIVSRAQWGADESRRHRAPRYNSGVDGIVVHHTGTTNDASDWALAVRQIYEFETANGYNDMSYHFLVDPHGLVYEGRWARTYPPGAVHDGENPDGKHVQGGHTKEHNKRTIGVALLGDFNVAAPTPAALESLLTLLTWKCARWELDPAESTIVGHGDLRDTECPGANLEALLPGICGQVASRLA